MSACEVEVLYDTVINDVVSQMREAFLDEGVDLDILQQFKTEWRAKVEASECVDFDRNKKSQVSRIVRSEEGASSSSRASGGGGQQQQRQQVIQRQYPGAGGPSNAQPPVSRLLTSAQPHLQPNAQRVVVDQQRFTAEQLAGSSGLVQPQQIVIMQGTNMLQHAQYGQAQHVLMPHIPVKTTPAIVKRQPPQLDGAADDDDDEDDVDDTQAAAPCSSKSTAEATAAGASKINKTKNPAAASSKMKKMPKNFVVQLDGHSDSSDNDAEGDEDGEFADEDVQQLMRRIGAKNMDASVQPETPYEEEPLNSDDDPSDDEDVETMFEVDNVVMCQFEKVSRIRNRWKFVLKDGIMHLDNRDHCFSKCTGEGEW